MAQVLVWDLPSWISPRIQYDPKRGSKARYRKSGRHWACEWRTRQKLSDFNNAKWFAKLQFIKNSVKRVAEKFLGEQRMTNEMTRTTYPIVKYCFGIFLVLLKFWSPLTVWVGWGGGRGAGGEAILTLAGDTPGPTEWVAYNSTHFWHCFLSGSVRFHIVRPQSHKASPTLDSGYKFRLLPRLLTHWL